MSAEVPSTTTTPVPPPSHAEMFFRYVAGLAQVANVQAFTMAIAVPKPDGTSAVLSTAGGMDGASAEWRTEIARLLSENASKSAQTIAQATDKATTEKTETPVETV